MRKGFTPQAKQISDLKTFPIPAITRWFSRTLPTLFTSAMLKQIAGSLPPPQRTAQQIGPQTGNCGEPQSARGVKAGYGHIEGDGQKFSRVPKTMRMWLRRGASTLARGRCASCRSSACA